MLTDLVTFDSTHVVIGTKVTNPQLQQSCCICMENRDKLEYECKVCESCKICKNCMSNHMELGVNKSCPLCRNNNNWYRKIPKNINYIVNINPNDQPKYTIDINPNNKLNKNFSKLFSIISILLLSFIVGFLVNYIFNITCGLQCANIYIGIISLFTLGLFITISFIIVGMCLSICCICVLQFGYN